MHFADAENIQKLNHVKFKHCLIYIHIYLLYHFLLNPTHFTYKIINSKRQEDEGYIYRRFEATVNSRDGSCHKCWTYTLMDIIEEPPSPQYLEVIRRGAEQNAVPAHYLERLKAIPDNGYQGNEAIFDSIINTNTGYGKKYLNFSYTGCPHKSGTLDFRYFIRLNMVF